MDRWLKEGAFKKIASLSSNVDVEIKIKATDRGNDDELQSTISISKVNNTSKIKRLTRKLSSSTEKRKYDESYLSFGFSSVMNEDYQEAYYVVCNKTLSNTSLAPAKLRKHLETNHPEYKDKDISLFKLKLDILEKSKLSMIKITKSDNEKATKASYFVSYRIALAGEAHTIGETLIKSCAKDIAICMLNEKSGEKVEAVPLSNNTVTRRIQDIADDIETQLISRLSLCNAYSLQLDESTDVAGLAVLLVFVRYDFNKSIEEDLLLCDFLESNTTGEEIFKCIDRFMKKHEISWEKCIDVCSDGAKAMVGKVAGAVSRIKSVAPKCTSNHCVLHRQSLVAKNIPSALKNVVDEAVQIVNYIKSRPLQSRLFKIMCRNE